MDTLIDTVNVSWCLNVGFLSVGFFRDNSGKFANIKLDKLTSKLGSTLKFGPAYSPWSKGINEQKGTPLNL